MPFGGKVWVNEENKSFFYNKSSLRSRLRCPRLRGASLMREKDLLDLLLDHERTCLLVGSSSCLNYSINCRLMRNYVRTWTPVQQNGLLFATVWHNFPMHQGAFLMTTSATRKKSPNVYESCPKSNKLPNLVALHTGSEIIKTGKKLHVGKCLTGSSTWQQNVLFSMNVQ